MTDQETLLEFPCQFPVKAMGVTSTHFDMTVVEIVRRHVADIKEGSVSSRSSKGGKYTAVTIVIEASSKEQLDAIYRDLTDHPDVLMAL